MNKFRLFFIFLCLIVSYSNAQYSAGGGFSVYKSINSDVTWQGIHGLIEFPRTESNTFFLRGTFMFPKKINEIAYATAVDFSVAPQQIEIDRTRKSSFLSIDGGNRTYFINTYDAGISPYFSSHARGIVGSYSESYSDYDTEKYMAPSSFDKATSVLFGMGLNIGVKYQLPYRGAVHFDIGAEYVLALYDAAYMMGIEISPISFFLNTSYRFDWY